jgi:hypothetical protein
MRRFSLLIMLGILANASVLFAQNTWQVQPTSTLPGQLTLRGFGKVDMQATSFTHAKLANVDQVRFDASSPEKAQIVLGKLIADLTLSPDITTQMQPIHGKSIMVVHAKPSQIYVVATRGRTAILWASIDIASLSDYLKDQMNDWDFATQQPAYPTYLDRFDRYGWGMYGLGVLNGHHGWQKKATDGPGFKDPIQDLEFLAENKIRFEPWLDMAGLDDSDGLVQYNEQDWQVSEAAKRGLPVGMRVYGDIGGSGANWTDRRFWQYADQPADFMMSGWHGPEIYWKARHHMAWNATPVHHYGTKRVMDMIAPYAKMDNVLSFMSPYGELRHDYWYDMHADYSKWASDSWRQYLQNKGYSLEQVSKMYKHKGPAFDDWQQIPVPEFATFNGLPSRVMSLAGNWFGKAEKQLDDGNKDKWWQVDIDDSWKSLHMPGGDEIFEIFPQKQKGNGWFRRSFDFPSNLKSDKPLYLYWYPITHAMYHSGDNARFHEIYINGQKAGEIGQWGAIDIAPYLKTGTNQIALHLIGGVWNGRIFMATDKPAIFPYLGSDMNQLWMDWRDWLVDSKYRAWDDALGGMRQVAPNKPYKFMAPLHFGTDNWLKLASDFGGWPHFTGEGMWFFPWYKRYSFLYGLPATSETAGPADNVDDLFNSYRRIFMAGLNGHDAVFLTQTYTRHPQMRQWFIDHMPVLHKLGKYDIAGPQVLLYRSTKSINYDTMASYPADPATSRKVQTGWDWDLGRGTLQTLGQSYLYLDDQALADGKMYGFNLMIDSGNETVDGNAVDNILQWVKAGGTYVSLPFTARSLLDHPDAWALLEKCGTSMIRTRPLGDGKVTFDSKQKLFPTLAGKQFDDNGQSLDWIGNNLNTYSVEIDPGHDGQVIARYDNGKAAIVRVPMGHGQVILMGSAFWRNAQDRKGIWWPQQKEVQFVKALLDSVNFEQAWCTTNDPLIWAQPYRTNNGMDRVSTLISWYEEQDKTLDITLAADHKPEQLWVTAVNQPNKSLPFTFKDGKVHATLTVPAREVVIVQMRDAQPKTAISHWWQYQTSHWKPVQVSQRDYSPYTQGKWEDPTLDLMPGWQFTQNRPNESWLQATGQIGRWQDANMGILNFQGAEDGKPLWARKTFEVPKQWLMQGGTITLVSGAWRGPHYHNKASLYLNGKMLHGPTTKSFNSFDITRLLEDGSNTLALEFEEGDKYVGVSGMIYLYHRKPPVKTVSLAGTWQLIDKQGKTFDIMLPNPPAKRYSGSRPSIQFDVPQSWQNKYHVRLRILGDDASALGAYINDRLVRRHHHRFDDRVDVDITSMLKFGHANQIELAGAQEERAGTRDRERRWMIRMIQLELFDIQPE